MPSTRSSYNYGKCHVCGGALVERKIDQEFRIKGELIVVREVPAGVCQRCGEKVVRAEVGKQLTAIVTDVNSLRRAATIAVPVVAFDARRV